MEIGKVEIIPKDDQAAAEERVAAHLAAERLKWEREGRVGMHTTLEEIARRLGRVPVSVDPAAVPHSQRDKIDRGGSPYFA